MHELLKIALVALVVIVIVDFVKRTFPSTAAIL